MRDGVHDVGHQVEYSSELGKLSIIQMHLSLIGQQHQISSGGEITLHIIQGRVAERCVKTEQGPASETVQLNMERLRKKFLALILKTRSESSVANFTHLVLRQV